MHDSVKIYESFCRNHKKSNRYFHLIIKDRIKSPEKGLSQDFFFVVKAFKLNSFSFTFRNLMFGNEILKLSKT